MAEPLTQEQLDARMKLVEEHVQAENNHDMNGIMATFGENPTFVLNDVIIPDRDSIRGFYEGFGFGSQGGFSDIKVEIKQRHIAEETIILEVTLTGKHTDTWQDIPATGREFNIPACAIFPFDDDGKLEGEKVYFDGTILLRQLGVLS